jgi:hypothetical protein
MGDGLMKCSMCDDAPATVFNKWPAPVCAECDEWLDSLDQELDVMEKDDPALGKAAGEIADAVQQLNREAP